MVPTSHKTLFLITVAYPFGHGEDWLQKELKALEPLCNEIKVFPLVKPQGDQRWLPANAQVMNDLWQAPASVQKGVYLSNLLTITSILRDELKHAGNKSTMRKKKREINSIIGQSIYRAQLLKKHIEQCINTPICYAAWQNEGALIFSLLKQQGVISHYDFKFHGFDLFNDRRDGYVPFRWYNMKHVRHAFHISKAGYNYMMQHDFKEKNVLYYSGVYDQGIGPFEEKVFTIASCSNIIPIKRVERMVDILQHLQFPVRWIHIGDGAGMEALQEQAAQLPEHITCEFKGRLSNAEVITLYQTTTIHLFMHLSSSEGGAPVAIQEAISFGIPAMGTDAGGIGEIVNEHTGVLLPNDFNDATVAQQITDFKHSNKNTMANRQQVKTWWSNHFNADVNFAKFAEALTS